MGIAESLEGGKLDHGLYVTFKQYRQHHDVVWRRFAQAGSNIYVVIGDVGYQNPFALECALAHQTLAHLEFVRQVLTLLVGVAAKEFHHGLTIGAGVYIENALLSINKRREFREHHLRYGGHIALPL